MKISCDTCRQEFGELLDNPEERDAAPTAIDASEVQEHLARCATCRDELMILQTARETMRNFSVLDAPPDLQSRIRQQLEAAPASAGNNYRSEEPNVITASGATSVINKPIVNKPFGNKPPKNERPPAAKGQIGFFNFLSRPANVAWVSCTMIVVAGFITLSLPRSEQYASPEPIFSEQAADVPSESAESELKVTDDGDKKADKATAAKPAAPKVAPTATPEATPKGTPVPGVAATETEPAWAPLPDLPPELAEPPTPTRPQQNPQDNLPKPAPKAAPKPSPKSAPPPAASTPVETRSSRARDDDARGNTTPSQTQRNRSSQDSETATAFSARPDRSEKSVAPAGPAVSLGPVTRTVATRIVSPRSIGWAQISVNLPGGVRFSDGTRARVVWRGTAPASEAISIDFEVQAESGSHPVTITLQEVKGGEAQTVASRTVTVSGSR